jgi:hypothetical protein
MKKTMTAVGTMRVKINRLPVSVRTLFLSVSVSVCMKEIIPVVYVSTNAVKNYTLMATFCNIKTEVSRSRIYFV